MDVLLEEIRSKDEAAASVLEQADLRSDSDLQLLTLQDLGELFPGVKHVKLRRKIFNIIQTLKPIDVLIKEFKGFIPHESLRAALTEHGVLVNYLKMLKEMKIEMNKVQDFLDAHINLLEDFRKSQPSQDQDKDSSSSSPEKHHNSQTCEPSQKQQDTSTSSPMLSPPSPTSTDHHRQKRQDSSSSSPEKHHNSQTCEPSQKQQDTSTSSANWLSSFAVFNRDHPEKRQATLKYKRVISGQTFNAHQQILEKVKALSEDPDLNLIEQKESNRDCQAIIVFCPIVSRMRTDIEAAMTQVKGSQPVILVLMHHTHEPRHVTFMKTWDGVSNVVLLSHVFYHETVHGLLQCQQNNSAISEIRKALLEHADIQTIKDTSGKTQNVAAESSSGYSFGRLIPKYFGK